MKMPELLMKSLHRLVQVLFLITSAFAITSCNQPDAPTVSSLEMQLAGNHCRFDFGWTKDRETCHLRSEGFWQWLLREKHHCDFAAVQCLATISTKEATDALINVLSSKNDVETCDGIYHVRTRAVELLGERGDERPIAPLERHLATSSISKLSSGASGCEARPESVEAIKEAIAKLGG